MNNPTELRNITAGMRHLLHSICEERTEALEAWESVVFWSENQAYTVRGLMRTEKHLTKAKRDWKLIQFQMLKHYRQYQALNAKRRQYRTSIKVKQLSMTF